ncbi:DNA helicase RecD [Streptomyces sp. LP05-1]|uniref:DNA helicase RecD n=1 Tax=Streptomyces pyxinae TaxID=2970734 RepID=A0ABT2CG88_9ACTN|nr:helix-hairpin-helix domain-containing protein [Streptomyces sp. LP05-1]MCS0636107.1 DNA helicase RecD [Streptomyces sp. LP05-1]
MTAPHRGETPGTPADDAPVSAAPEPVDSPAPDGPAGGSGGDDSGADAAGGDGATAAEPDDSDTSAPSAPSGSSDSSDFSDPSVPDSAGSTAEEDGPGSPEGGDGATERGDGPAEGGGLSEAQAELAAQQELRARIEERKAARSAPVESGTKLSGQAADLLAAVRAVESGTTSGTAFYPALAPAERAPAAPESPEGAAPRRAAVPAPGPVATPHRAETPGPAPVPEEARAAVGEVLARGGAPEALAGPVLETLGAPAAELLRADPWRLLLVAGVRPEQADGFARALLGPEAGPGDDRRAAALVGWLLERAARRGHTALELAAVRAELARQRVPDPDEAVRAAVAEGAVLVFQPEAEGEPGAEAPETPAAGHDADGAPDAAPAGPPEAETAGEVPVLLGLDRYALAEESLADGLARLARSGADPRWERIEPAGELSRALAGHGLVAHTGGEAARAEPVELAGAAGALGLRALVLTHAENGRRRLAGAEVATATVGGLLSGAAGPGRDEDGALALDLLVVLDAPQLDVETAAMLVEALPDGCRLVLSGDPAVLGSAGAGQVFADVLAARVCPRIASRRPDPGPVGELVSGIGVGELNQVEAPGREVVIVPVREPGEAVHRTVQLVADSVPRVIGVPAARTQVITVGHGGPAGTRALNAALKERLNPGPGRFGGFDPGDRVAYTPAPGRTAQATVAGADAEGLRLDCEGEPVRVPRERVESAVRHGWALTAHQAAGMRWAAAVVVLPGDAAGALDRAWVYTAFGRGERHLSVVHGVDQALPRAVADVPAPARTTRLRPLLEGLLAEPATE